MLYRRHIIKCQHRSKGAAYTLCHCPIWVDGLLNGKRYRRSLGTRDWATAENRIRMLADGTIDVAESDRSRLTLGKAIDLYRADQRARAIRESTITGQGYTFRPLLAVLGAETPLPSITLSDLQRMRATRDVKHSTNFKEIVEIKSFFNWAVGAGHLTVSPAAKLRFPRVQFAPTLPYSEGEISALLDSCDRITARANEDTAYFRRRARAFLLLLLYSGLRIVDAAYLRRDALNPVTGYLTLRTLKTGADIKVKLHPDALAALDRLPALHPEYFFWDGKSPAIRDSLRSTIYRLGRLAKVKGARPHRFRDHFASELLKNGVEIRTVQLLLGHESVRTTEKHYGHFSLAHQSRLDSATATLNFSGRPALRPVSMHPLKNRRGNA